MILQYVKLEEMSAANVLVLRTSWPTILSIKTDVILGRGPGLPFLAPQHYYRCRASVQDRGSTALTNMHA